MLRRQWAQVAPFFAYPPAVRKIICTTSAIERMHAQLRQIVKNRGHFPSDEAAGKLLYLALRNSEKERDEAPDYLETGSQSVCHSVRWKIIGRLYLGERTSFPAIAPRKRQSCYARSLAPMILSASSDHRSMVSSCSMPPRSNRY